ncbi:NADH pyrophosphatase, partial [Mesorhizobium sp. M8A.F.Ca.ET.021.01.1.1]
MSFRLFDAPVREPSQFVGFAGNTIDRQSENRADDSVDKALADPTTRLLLMNGGRLYLKLADGGFDPWYRIAESDPFSPSFDQGVLLGFSEQGPVLAVLAGIDAEQLPETVKAIDYRSVYMQGL